MMKNMMLIVNPLSGRGQAKSSLCDIIALFGSEGYAVTVYVTGKWQGAEYFAREYGGNYDIVVCIGGDGTLSDTANGLMQTGSPPPHLGYIPMGTANDVATTLTLSKKPVEAAYAIAKGTPTPIDMGSFNEKYFTYVAAFGAFTEVSYSTTQKSKKALGHAAYFFEGIAHVPEIKPQHTIVEYDDGVIEGDFVFGGVTNSLSVAGMVKLDPRDVDLGDGFFEVILIRQPVKFGDMSTIVANILTKNYNPDNVILLHTRKVQFTFDTEVAWTRDGENGGMHMEVSIENHRQALKIIV